MELFTAGAKVPLLKTSWKSALLCCLFDISSLHGLRKCVYKTVNNYQINWQEKLPEFVNCWSKHAGLWQRANVLLGVTLSECIISETIRFACGRSESWWWMFWYYSSLHGLLFRANTFTWTGYFVFFNLLTKPPIWMNRKIFGMRELWYWCGSLVK